jgi:hypothetical protein
MTDSEEPLKLYRFRYFDTVLQKWRTARHAATLEDITRQNEQWTIIGSPEIRHPLRGTTGHVQRPWTPEPQSQAIAQSPVAPDMPELDATEAMLVRVFCRRYIVWCAKKGDRVEQIRGALNLLGHACRVGARASAPMTTGQGA